MKKPLNWHRIWRQFKVYVIFVIAVFAFAILGMFQSDGYFTGGGMAAQVNGRVISMKDYRDQLNLIQQQMEAQFGSLPAAQRQMFENSMKSQALSRLISSEVLFQSAEKEGVVASDAEVRQEILDVPFFNENGRFVRERYENYLRNTRMSASSFEDQLRKQVVTQKLRDLFSKTIRSSKEESEFNHQAKNIKYNIEFVDFRKDQLKANIQVSESDVDKLLAENEQRVKDHYHGTKDKYTQKEKVRARHILIKTQAGDQASDKKAKEKIEKIASELTLENFSEKAKQYSEDPGSKIKGGDLGFFEKGRMVKEFEKVAFSQPVGEISKPVKSNFGYHIILVDEKQETKVSPFEEQKRKVAKELLQQDQINKELEVIETALKDKNNTATEAFLKKHKLSWKESGEFNLSSAYIPKIGVADSIWQKVLNLRQKGQTVAELMKNNGKNYLVRLKDLKSAPASASEELPQDGAKVTAIFTSWLESEQKEAKIIRNSALVSQPRFPAPN